MDADLSYNLPFSCTDRKAITDTIHHYLLHIMEQYSAEKIIPQQYGDILLLLSEAYPFVLPDRCEEMGYKLCRTVKEDLEAYGSHPSLGMFSGLGKKAFAVSLYSKRTNRLKAFSQAFNLFLLEKAAEHTKQLMQPDSCAKASDYDAIDGISGILFYLLEFEWDKEEQKLLVALADYLISLTREKAYKGVDIMRFHLPSQSLFSQAEQALYPEGILDFGLAHGMLGPLLALSKAAAKGIAPQGIQYAMDKIQYLYDTFQTGQNGVAAWPTILTFEEYAQGIFPTDPECARASWCYGNIAIARGLQLAARNRGDDDRESKYQENLLHIIAQPIEAYHLTNFGLCHGYAGVLAICSRAYQEIAGKTLTHAVQRVFAHIKVNNILLDKEHLHETPNRYFEDKNSFLQGPEGFILSLLSALYRDTSFGQLLMIQ